MWPYGDDSGRLLASLQRARVRPRDVLAYKVKRDLSRRKTLDDLARAEYEEGIYDQVPDDFNLGQ